ncbi:Dbl homology domain-containing protein, partial [Trametes punicea]
PQVVVHEASSSWRSTLSDDVYLTLSRHYGPMEMERQELIFSFFVSEKAFAQFARQVVRTVLLPLRACDSRMWLPGLPQDITRLFDWLEDVVNLHTAIVHAVSAVTAIWQTGSIVQRLAGTLKGFIPRLEVYMPYLAKYDSVRDAIRWHAEQDHGEFGEYLRLKERDREEGHWSLDRLLQEPAERLRSYIDVFQVRCSSEARSCCSEIASETIRVDSARTPRPPRHPVAFVFYENRRARDGRGQGARRRI